MVPLVPAEESLFVAGSTLIAGKKAFRVLVFYYKKNHPASPNHPTSPSLIIQLNQFTINTSHNFTTHSTAPIIATAYPRQQRSAHRPNHAS
jgi:hypothetical protein